MPSFLGHPRVMFIAQTPPVFATWNPAGTDDNITLSDGNLTGHVSGPTAGTAYGMSATSGYNFDDGKRYFEIRIDNIAGSPSGISVGFSDTDQMVSGELGDMTYAYAWRADGYRKSAGVATVFGSGAVNGDVIQLAIHAYIDGGSARAKIWFGKNGVWFGSGNPALSVSPAFDGVIAPIATDWGVRATMKVSGDRLTGNFGSSPFLYGVPSGFGSGWGIGIL